MSASVARVARDVVAHLWVCCLPVIVQECDDVEVVEAGVAIVIRGEVTLCEQLREGEHIFKLDKIVAVVVCGMRGGAEGEDLVRVEIGVGVEAAVGPRDLDGFDFGFARKTDVGFDGGGAAVGVVVVDREDVVFGRR